MQSEHISVLVGPDAQLFKVPQARLFHYMSKVAEGGNLRVNEALVLTDVEPSTFEDFFVWICEPEPSLEGRNAKSVVELAIMAELHKIHLLKNQTSDIMLSALKKKKPHMTPATVDKIYGAVPSGSVLRRLAFGEFLNAIDDRNDHAIPHWIPKKPFDYDEWKSVFGNHSDFGWDYFHHNIVAKGRLREPHEQGACKFHDHSDIVGWVPSFAKQCPYPYGAPLSVPEVEILSEALPEDLPESGEPDANGQEETVAVVDDPPVSGWNGRRGKNSLARHYSSDVDFGYPAAEPEAVAPEVEPEPAAEPEVPALPEPAALEAEPEAVAEDSWYYPSTSPRVTEKKGKKKRNK